MADIRELDERTVERIAAGEVVERPASAVKELVENSLDAGADRVDVTVAAGGTESIRVADDGRGMTESEARRAVEEHTTSKITDIDDLEGVYSLGFRGEALHAIGAVSRLTVTTRPNPAKRGDGDAGDGADATARGTELTVEGGDVTAVEPAGCPVGTTVEVRDLFYNVPARRKYLKQESTEFARINAVVTSYALARPDVAVSLTHGDRETFATTGQGDRREAVMSVYGREVAASMIPVEEGVSEGPLEDIAGLVSHPETNRSTRDYLSTFVNGRYVTDATVRDAVVEAYGTQLASDRYPFAVLDLSVDPRAVDVNVHPRKLEVRWSQEAAVREQVQTTVENALQRAGLLRSSAPRGRSAPDQATIEPSSSEVADEPAAEAENANESAADSTGESAVANRDASSESTPTDGPNEPSRSELSPSSPAVDSDGSAESSGDTSPESTPDPAQSSDPHESSSRTPLTTDPNTQTTLSGDDAHETTSFDTLPNLRVLGQLQDTYIVAEADDGLLLIDQHAADERINYERLREQFDGDTTTQVLAEPVDVTLTAGEAELFTTYKNALERLGFQATRVDDRTVEVTTVPSIVADAASPAVIRDVLSDLVTGDREGKQTVESMADELLADLACYPSITGNTSLTDGSVVDLLSTLDACDNPWACPHGRPVLIHVDSDEIENRFERDYPGH